jgi:hypothetical protein
MPLPSPARESYRCFIIYLQHCRILWIDILSPIREDTLRPRGYRSLSPSFSFRTLCSDLSERSSSPSDISVKSQAVLFRYNSLENANCKDICPTTNWQIFVAIRHHIKSAQNKSGHRKTLAIRWVRLGLQMTPSLFRPLGFLLDARALAARMYSVEESRKRSLHAERQAQYQKRYKEKSRISE